MWSSSSIRFFALATPPCLGVLVGNLAIAAVPPTDAEAAAQAAANPKLTDPCKLRPVGGLSSRTLAVYPMIDDPVAIAIDERGRIFVAESDRQELGVEDNRSSRWWLLDDLQAQSTADRLKMYEKWAAKREGGMAYYSKYADRVSMLEDTNGDGIIDHREIFAGPFNDPLIGTGAGLLCRDGDVWYTNIPSLWRLRDRDGDGVAEIQESVYDGFGVRVALRGHDMHGLAWGPDGKLYWSIGDRGYNVRTPEGEVLHDPRAGAVFRCNPDGSAIELFCTGLRNPQELAFDDFGNLFTGDNNSDGGDSARFVYCVEGGETGWRMEYQTLDGVNQRGPWNQEGIWHLRADLAPTKTLATNPLQPAWTVPPLAHVGSGPSGLVCYPGTGLDASYQGAFFLCDFLGGASYSQVLAVKLQSFGAGFQVTSVEPFIENVLATDLDFAPDGRIIVCDWGDGWYSGNKGELYAVWDAKHSNDAAVLSTAQLLREGFTQRDNDELRELLAHQDRRIRQRAQWELAARGTGTTSLLGDAAQTAPNVLARVHAVWALGQQAEARRASNPNANDQLDPLRFVAPLLNDNDAEIRAQASKVLGEARAIFAAPKLAELCADPAPRVRYFASMALGRMRAIDEVPWILSMIAENNDQDVFLRHAGVVALFWMQDPLKLGELAADPRASVRLAALLAMRKSRDPRVAQFLEDPERLLRLEAARAINDLELDALTPKLAQALVRMNGENSAVISSAPSATPRHEFVREVWKLDRVGTVSDLADTARFNSPPDEVRTLDVPDAPRNAGDKFIARIRGTIEAPQTGAYTFAIASDDDSVLFIGADESPSTLREVARVEGYSNVNEFTTMPSQSSGPIQLEQGKRYAFEARHAEGGGGDHLTVRWTLPDGAIESPLGAAPIDTSEFPLTRRALYAALREGTPEYASEVCTYALGRDNPEPMRIEAIAILGEWLAPGVRDRVNGAYRPIDASARSADAFKAVLTRRLAPLAEDRSAAIRAAVLEMTSKHGVSLDPDAALRAISDPALPERERVASLRSLAADTNRGPLALQAALASESARLRLTSRSIAASLDFTQALPSLREAVASGSLIEQQSALRDLAKEPSLATEIVAPLAQQLADGSLPSALALETAEIAKLSTDAAILSALERFNARTSAEMDRYTSLCLEGGDAERGRQVVLYHQSAVCVKCHMIEGTGGNAAPPLDGVALHADARSILESLITPQAVVVENFGPISAMPKMGPILTSAELRDVVAYLLTLKTPVVK